MPEHAPESHADDYQDVRSTEKAMGDDTDSTLYCPYCSYDLRALTGDACPECGGAVDAASLKAVEVPWQSRYEVGRVRALFRTAGRVMFHTKRFCHAVGRPVSYPDARKFQACVVTLFWVSLLCVVATPVAINVSDVAATFDRWGWALSLGYVLSGTVGLWLFLFLATGLHTYWLHPKHISVERQDRAVAIGYYACGPLVYAALGGVPIIAGMVYPHVVKQYARTLHETVAVGLVGVGLLLMLVGVTSCWRVCFVMAERVAHRGPVGRWSLPLIQPLLVFLLGLLLPIGLPVLILYLYLIAGSF